MSFFHAEARQLHEQQAADDRELLRRIAELRDMYFDGEDRLKTAADDISLFMDKMRTDPDRYRGEALAFVETLERLLAELYSPPIDHVH